MCVSKTARTDTWGLDAGGDLWGPKRRTSQGSPIFRPGARRRAQPRPSAAPSRAGSAYAAAVAAAESFTLTVLEMPGSSIVTP